ncbi:MAG: amino acid racemase [Synergistales bacterium]|nr:amino acid racemase [Synergistales bacterium]
MRPDEPTRPALGVLGGMGPAASAAFLRILAERTPAERDQDHPVVYLLSDPTVPNRTDALLGKGPDPTYQLRANLERLIAWGATLLAVPCNTAHAFLDRFRDELGVPLVHIVEATLATAAEANPEEAWLTASDGTVATGLYQRYANRKGYILREPEPSLQEQIQRTIALVKAGQTDRAAERFVEVAGALRAEADIPLVLACTELPLAADAAGLSGDRAVSSLTALADAVLERL